MQAQRGHGNIFPFHCNLCKWELVNSDIITSVLRLEKLGTARLFVCFDKLVLWSNECFVDATCV